MYDGNPEEIDFGSSKCEVQVGEGLSYQEWTAQFIYSDLAGKIEASAIIIIISYNLDKCGCQLYSKQVKSKPSTHGLSHVIYDPRCSIPLITPVVKY